MLTKPGVLNGHHGVEHVGRDLIDFTIGAVLFKKGGDQLAGAGMNSSRLAGFVALKRTDIGQSPRKMFEDGKPDKKARHGRSQG